MRIFSCFNTLGFKLGGVESYYMRMYCWAKSEDFKLMFFMPKGEKVVKEWIPFFEKYNISIIYYEKLGADINLQTNDKIFLDTTSKGSLCITNSIDTFAAANKIFRNLRDEINIIFYVLHPYAIRLCKKKLINRLGSAPILFAIKDSSLVFMDEETRDFAKKQYPKMKFSGSKIIRLGMEIPAFCLEQRKGIYQKENFTILSVARFDFPFKGYVIGLINTYAKLKKRFSNLDLIIIGDGDGKEELEQELECISDNDIRMSIYMLGHIPYDEIGKYIEQANVFVGMGTTILDAAKYGVPGIVVTAYQMEDYAVGFFTSDYTCIGKLIDEEGAKKYRIGELIEEIYGMAESDYLKICKECHDLVKEHYGIENCMAQIMKVDGTKKIKISFGISFFYNCLLPLWRKLKSII